MYIINSSAVTDKMCNACSFINNCHNGIHIFTAYRKICKEVHSKFLLFRYWDFWILQLLLGENMTILLCLTNITAIHKGPHIFSLTFPVKRFTGFIQCPLYPLTRIIANSMGIFQDLSLDIKNCQGLSLFDHLHLLVVDPGLLLIIYRLPNVSYLCSINCCFAQFFILVELMHTNCQI